jgi:hypothetical protein
MTDAVLVTVTIAFFLLAVGLVRLCATFIEDDGDEDHLRSDDTGTPTGAPADLTLSARRTGAG